MYVKEGLLVDVRPGGVWEEGYALEVQGRCARSERRGKQQAKVLDMVCFFLLKREIRVESKGEQ